MLDLIHQKNPIKIWEDAGSGTISEVGTFYYNALDMNVVKGDLILFEVHYSGQKGAAGGMVTTRLYRNGVSTALMDLTAGRLINCAHHAPNFWGYFNWSKTARITQSGRLYLQLAGDCLGSNVTVTTLIRATRLRQGTPDPVYSP